MVCRVFGPIVALTLMAIPVSTAAQEVETEILFRNVRVFDGTSDRLSESTSSRRNELGSLRRWPRITADLPADASDEVYFDVTGNSTSDSTPVGSINRARWPSEVASRKARMQTANNGKQQHPPFR